MKKRILAYALILVGVLLQVNQAFFDKIFGEWYCGDEYLKPINGLLTEQSCGFNNDMYLGVMAIFCVAVGTCILIFGFLRFLIIRIR